MNGTDPSRIFSRSSFEFDSQNLVLTNTLRQSIDNDLQSVTVFPCLHQTWLSVAKDLYSGTPSKVNGIKKVALVEDRSEEIDVVVEGTLCSETESLCIGCQQPVKFYALSSKVEGVAIGSFDQKT